VVTTVALYAAIGIVVILIVALGVAYTRAARALREGSSRMF
jgi:hypothetical protein